MIAAYSMPQDYFSHPYSQLAFPGFIHLFISDTFPNSKTQHCYIVENTLSSIVQGGQEAEDGAIADPAKFSSCSFFAIVQCLFISFTSLKPSFDSCSKSSHLSSRDVTVSYFYSRCPLYKLQSRYNIEIRSGYK